MDSPALGCKPPVPGIPNSPSPARRFSSLTTLPDLGGELSDSDDEEMLMLKLLQSEAEQARIRAEQQELKAKIALRELRRKKRLRQHQHEHEQHESASLALSPAISPTGHKSVLSTPTKQSSLALVPGLSPDANASQDGVPATPDDAASAMTPRRSVRKHFSPEQQKVHNDEIIKRRRLDFAPAIKNSLLPAVLRTPSSSDSHAANISAALKPQVLVPKSPSPIKPKREDVIPLRQMLGLDKGLSAHDISLTHRKKPKLSDTVPKSSVIVRHTETGRTGAHVAPTMGLKSTRMAQVERTRHEAVEKRRGTAYAGIAAKPVVGETAVGTGMAFGERLMAARRRGNVKKEPSDAGDSLKKRLEKEDARKAEKKGRLVDERMASLKRASPAVVSDSTTRPPDDDSDDDLEVEPPLRSTDKSSVNTSDSVATTTTPPSSPPKTAEATLGSKLSGTQTDLYDPYTKLALLTRYVSVADVDASMQPKKVFTVSSLYAAVAPPEYDPPVYPDWAVFGVVARKSSIMYTKRRPTLKKNEDSVERPDPSERDWKKVIASATAEHGTAAAEPRKRKAQEPTKKKDVNDDEEENMQARRYFILKLTDLKQDLDVFVMGPPLDKFWKLRLGDVVAFINPGVWPPKSGGTGFNLNVTERDDEVVEVGRARDFSMCKALTRKETPCRNWVDLRKTEYCEFHIELAVRRTSGRRAEVNKGTTMFSPKKNGQRMIMTRGGGREGLLPDPLAPRPDRANRSGAKIYCLERFQDDDTIYTPARSTFRGH
ncbi:hypothetical protein POJ06DRAFT_271844 [Lipomyces tetrasporus]|uniref:Zinc finger Mcm10/DnaG-type domain-containing protein n=1 Tax=Lipomyces tetrasporus TaxID=54092 RepID=A0AAD7QKM4_9ASCO|nr:uncharacterized protein POJ06DRAFT_271844 [Lipomyces tetrasporus]KAJ8096824.1 hypothetical protein POJ06DRAFT_271844 [Lipomyces tetrasporus]